MNRVFRWYWYSEASGLETAGWWAFFISAPLWFNASQVQGLDSGETVFLLVIALMWVRCTRQLQLRDKQPARLSEKTA